ncbi:MAG TPA: hypothetical protein VI391_06685 [Thermoanaerobaculia bacterium]
MLTALIVLALAQQRQRPSTPAAPAWTIELSTDGGFTGSGSGGLTVGSDGKLGITLVNKKQCTFQLSTTELQSLNDAIANARPAAWLECYSLADLSTHCCDLIRTTLKLNAGKTYVTSWLNGSGFPADLQAIVEALRGPGGIDARYRPLCTP